MPQSSNHGFTLLELLVVLAIMGLLILALPQLTPAGRENVAARAAAYELAATMRRARAEAIASNAETALVIDERQHNYHVEPGNVGHDIRPDLNLKVQGLTDGDLAVARLRFFPDGSSSGGEVQVIPENGRGHDVVVHPISGRVDVDE